MKRKYFATLYKITKKLVRIIKAIFIFKKGSLVNIFLKNFKKLGAKS